MIVQMITLIFSQIDSNKIQSRPPTGNLFFAFPLLLKHKTEFPLRGCLHDNSATFIPGRDEKLHCVYIKPCLLGCESYSAVKLMKL